MKCQKVERLLLESLDSASSPAVRDHLDSCRDCRKLWVELGQLEGLRRSLSHPKLAPGDFTGRVTLGISKSRRSHTVRYLAASLLLILFAGALGWLNTKETDRVAWAESSELTLSSGGEVLFSGDGQIHEAVPVWIDGSVRYVEVMITDASGETYLVRIPSRLQVRQADDDRDGYLTYVSH